MTHHKIPSIYASITASLITSLMLVACGVHTDPQTSIAKAKEYLEKKNPGAASIELKNALQTNPDLAEARFLLGKSYLQDGQSNAAEIELRKALALKFDADQTLPLIANSVLAQGKPDKVLAEFEQQKLQSAEAQAELTSLIGMAYFSAGKPDEAQQKFSDAQKIIPAYPAAVLGNARVLAAKGDFSGAEAGVNQVLAKDPKDWVALMFKGDLHRAQNQFDKAIAAYEQVVADQPKNLNAHLNLANTYLVTGKVDAGRAQIEALKKIAPKHPGVSYFEALLAYTEKQYEKADEAIQRTLLAAPDNAQALLLAGAVELQLNRPGQSEQHLRKALTLSPNNLYGYKKLVTLYITQKEPLKAQEVLQTAIKIGPNDPDLLTLAGDIALAKGEFSQASAYLNQATQVSPKDARALTQSALAQFAQGNNEHAIAQLESATKLETDQTNPRPDVLLLLAHMQHREYDKAMQAWDALQKKQPDNALIYNLQAGILLAKNDIPGARKALEHTLSLQPANLLAASNLAKLDLQDKKPDAAKQRFRTILEKDKTNLSALLALAGLEQASGAPKETILQLINQARQGNPDSTEPVITLVSYYLNAGDGKQALATVKEALVTAPKNQQLLNLAGTLHIRLGETGQAVDTYTQLATDNPNQTKYLLLLGQAQVVAGKIEAAKQTMSKALALSPDAKETQVAVVNAFLSAGKPDDALKMVEEIRKLSPKSINLSQLEGDVLAAKHDYPAAATAYQKGLSSGPTNGLLIKTHQALTLTGKKPEAEALLNVWLKAHPDDVGVQIYLADLAMNAGEFAKAKTQYTKLLNSQANNPKLLNNLAWTSFQLKDVKALDFAEKAYALAPTNPDIVDTLGWILVEQGQSKRGIELLEKASAQFPAQGLVKLHLAKALLKDGRKDKARELLQTLANSMGNTALGKESAQLLSGL